MNSTCLGYRGVKKAIFFLRLVIIEIYERYSIRCLTTACLWDSLASSVLRHVIPRFLTKVLLPSAVEKWGKIYLLTVNHGQNIFCHWNNYSFHQLCSIRISRVWPKLVKWCPIDINLCSLKIGEGISASMKLKRNYGCFVNLYLQIFTIFN